MAAVSAPERVIAALVERGLTLGVAESLTGGALCSALVSVPGASKALRGGIVAYDTAIKSSLLAVDSDLLEREGAVHPDVAKRMALGVRIALATVHGPASVGVATTGVAGPDMQDGKPVGTVFVAVALGDAVSVVEHRFAGDRAEIRVAAVGAALEFLCAALEENTERES